MMIFVIFTDGVLIGGDCFWRRSVNAINNFLRQFFLGISCGGLCIFLCWPVDFYRVAARLCRFLIGNTFILSLTPYLVALW
jgi:hypothetical protein